jgi:hypothetical protein
VKADLRRTIFLSIEALQDDAKMLKRVNTRVKTIPGDVTSNIQNPRVFAWDGSGHAGRNILHMQVLHSPACASVENQPCRMDDVEKTRVERIRHKPKNNPNAINQE